MTGAEPAATGAHLRNLTPHPVVLHGRDGARMEIDPEAVPARVDVDRVTLPALKVEEGTVPLVWERSGSVSGLPAPEDDTLFIVSRVVAVACRDRTDLVYPADLKRDADGTVVGATSLGTTQSRLSLEPDHLVVLSGSASHEADGLGLWVP